MSAHDSSPEHLVSPRVSGMAIGSLILGLLGCTSPVGLVLGIVAILQINNDPDRITGKGYAIAGIVVSGLMMLLGPALYIAAAMPVLLRAREQSPAAQCLDNVKNLAFALSFYTLENDGRLPPRANWSDAVTTCTYGEDGYTCPADRSRARCSYVFSDALAGVWPAALTDPRSTPMLWDGTPGWNVSGGLSSVVYRHPDRSGGVPVDRATVAFADGHAKPMAEMDLRGMFGNSTGAVPPSPPAPPPPPALPDAGLRPGEGASPSPPATYSPPSRGGADSLPERAENASRKAQKSACLSNLKQVGLACLMYTQDYDERWAPAARWCDGTRPYLRNDEVYVCPVLPGARCGYTLNARLGGIRLGEIARPQETPAAFDGMGGWNRSGGMGDVVYRHENDANVVFSDGHARGLDRQGLESVWTQNR